MVLVGPLEQNPKEHRPLLVPTTLKSLLTSIWLEHKLTRNTRGASRRDSRTSIESFGQKHCAWQRWRRSILKLMLMLYCVHPRECYPTELIPTSQAHHVLGIETIPLSNGSLPITIPSTASILPRATRSITNSNMATCISCAWRNSSQWWKRLLLRHGMAFRYRASLKTLLHSFYTDTWGRQIAGEQVRRVDRVLDVRQGELCYVAGTVYMDMPLKPNILDDISKDVRSPSSLNSRYYRLVQQLADQATPKFSIGLPFLHHVKNTSRPPARIKSCSKTSRAASASSVPLYKRTCS